MRITLTWVALFIIEAFGIAAVWIFVTGRWQVNPHGTPAHLAAGLLLAIAIFVAIMVIFLTPVWMLRSCLIVKKAIESAQIDDYKSASSYLSRKLLLLPRYAEIIFILRQLCEDRKRKPKGVTSEFSKYIVMDEWGDHALSLEGKEKMIKKINSGWLGAEKAEKFGSPKTIRILNGPSRGNCDCSGYCVDCSYIYSPLTFYENGVSVIWIAVRFRRDKNIRRQRICRFVIGCIQSLLHARQVL